MPKINFIIHFFLEILHFKESSNFTSDKLWAVTCEPEFCEICDWWWNIKNSISFHIRLFPGITDDKSFQKFHFGAIFTSLSPNLDKNEFSWKKGLCQFLNIPIIYHHAEKSEKNNEPLLWKMQKWRTDRQTDRQTDGRTDSGDFIGPSVGRGSNKPFW